MSSSYMPSEDFCFLDEAADFDGFSDKLWFRSQFQCETDFVTAIPMDDEDYLSDPDFAEVLEVLGDAQSWPTHEISDGEYPTIHAHACCDSHQQLPFEGTYFVTAIPFDDQFTFDRFSHSDYYNPKFMRHSLDGEDLSACVGADDGSHSDAEMVDLDVEEIQKLLYLEDIENWEEDASSFTSFTCSQPFHSQDIMSTLATVGPPMSAHPTECFTTDNSGQLTLSKRQRLSAQEHFSTESTQSFCTKRPSPRKDAPRTSRQLATARRERERGKFKRNTISWVPVTDLFD